MTINNKLFHLLIYEEHISDPHKRSLKYSMLYSLEEYFDNLNFYKEDCKCPICFESINKIQFIKTRCNHIFHSQCLKKWKSKQNQCPICREALCDCMSCSVQDKIKESSLHNNISPEVVNVLRYMFNL